MSEKCDEMFLKFCRADVPDRTADELELLALILHKAGDSVVDLESSKYS